jgi:hypothetical protein
MFVRSFTRIACLCLGLVACRGTAPSAQTVSDAQLRQLVDSLMPGVSKATGLAFKSVPKSAVRTREQIHTYLVAKMARDLPPTKLEGIDDTYRLLDLLSDSTNLRQLFLDLYTEQIAGFYDPDSTTLYAVKGTDPAQLRLVLAHELVHALQHQYVPLDSILRDSTNGDRQAAAQAIMEGQATLASLEAMMPGMDLANNDTFWSTFRAELQAQQQGTSLFARAPMVIRETLTFPYVAGANFVRWFDRTHPGKMPFGSAMPVSTEQIMHPDRYARGDEPIDVQFDGDTTGVIFDDTFGAFDVALLRAGLQHSDTVDTDEASGWGGDRLRIYRTPDGPALVWVTAWDTPAAAGRFQAMAGGIVARPGYRLVVRPVSTPGRSVVRVVIAPTNWTRWSSIPAATVGAPVH